MTLTLALTAAGRASVPLVQASGWVSAAHRLKAQHSTGSLPTFQRSGCPSQRALSLPTWVVAEGGGSARLDSEEESGAVGKRLFFSSVLGEQCISHLLVQSRATSLHPQGHAVSHRTRGEARATRSSREGGRMAGRAERRRGPPRCGEGRGWLRCWAGAHSASRLRQRRVPCWYLRASG